MEKQSGLMDQWDREADVVVIGYGGAGAVAAIEAHESSNIGECMVFGRIAGKNAANEPPQ